jgi:plastocyanin
MHPSLSLLLVGFFTYALLPTTLTGATLEGTFTFEQPPRVALVYFSEDNSRPASDEIIVDQKDKDFTTILTLAAPGGTVKFRNSDEVQHSVFADDKELGINFDTGLVNPKTESSQTVSWKEGQVVRCGCKIHPKMQMWVAAVSSRYYKAVTFTPGKKDPVSFTISDVPAQYSKVRIWVPRFDIPEVTLAPEKEQAVDIKRNDKVFGSIKLLVK